MSKGATRKIEGALFLGSYALGFLGGTSKVATRFFNFFPIFQIYSRFLKVYIFESIFSLKLILL